MNGSNHVARSVGVFGRSVAALASLGMVGACLVAVAPDAVADPWEAPDTPQFKFAATKKVKPGSATTKGVTNVRPSKVTWPTAVKDAPVATLPKVGSRGRATGTPISVARVKAEDPGQVRMVLKADAQHVVDLPLHPVGRGKKTGCGIHIRLVDIGIHGKPDTDIFFEAVEVINNRQLFSFPVGVVNAAEVRQKPEPEFG